MSEQISGTEISSAASTPNSYGAVDLSAMTANPTAAGAGIANPGAQVDVGTPMAGSPQINTELIVDVTEANLEDQMALSQTVPVILVFYSGRSLTSRQTVEILEDSIRRYAGAFELGKIDVDTQASLAQALQIQTTPTAMALVARRPVPLFEGPATTEQLDGLFAELLQVAPQLGVTGRISVNETQLEKPMPESHKAPRAAEAEENWEQAILLWKKVLANNPGDSEAKLALRRAEFEARQVERAPGIGDDPLSQADSLFGSGQEATAFALLLKIITEPESPEQKEAARLRLVELFQIAGDSTAVKQARIKLSNLLMV